MLHLQVEGSGHNSHDVALAQIEAGGVHEVQEDAKAFGVDLWVQVDHIQVAFQLIGEDAVEKATGKKEKPRRIDQKLGSSFSFDSSVCL